MTVRFDERPILVFWETTRACPLACRHCRAEAQREAMPGELDTAEGLRLIEEVASFGQPRPVLILTGGDCLQRPDVEVLVAHARSLGVPVALSPSVSPSLSAARLSRLHDLGVRTVSVSLDGATPATHDGIRGLEGHFDQTMEAIALLRRLGFTVQVNTTVMTANLAELSDIAAVVAWSGAAIWEVFFLIAMGRGRDGAALSPAQCEDVAHLLVDVSARGLVVRTVEGPFFRRVAALRRDHPAAPSQTGPLYRRLAARLEAQLGAPPGRPGGDPLSLQGGTAAPLAPDGGATRRSPPSSAGLPAGRPSGANDATHLPRIRTASTRDGSGIIFIAYDGAILPSGFLPLPLGDVRRDSLSAVYRGHPLLLDIREARFSGRCGRCPYRRLCGGSRARAYAVSGDPLGEDPACAFDPAPLLAEALP
jgi:MoaA/NifB/PqqE/SkfB family radical SAM enzyme